VVTSLRDTPFERSQISQNILNFELKKFYHNPWVVESFIVDLKVIRMKQIPSIFLAYEEF
jgi:hypothetical protein